MPPAIPHVRADAVDGAAENVVLEIDVSDRWHALALSELLIPFHSFLVQYGLERWVVHARATGCRGEPLTEAFAASDQWRDERAIEAALRVDGQPHGDRP